MKAVLVAAFQNAIRLRKRKPAVAAIRFVFVRGSFVRCRALVINKNKNVGGQPESKRSRLFRIGLAQTHVVLGSSEDEDGPVPAVRVRSSAAQEKAQSEYAAQQLKKRTL